MRKVLLVLVCFVTIAGVLNCGSSSNEKAVCDAMIDQLLKACDQSNPADVQTVLTAFASFGITYTATEIENNPKSEFANDCANDLEEENVSITDEQKDVFIQAVNQIPTTDCATAAYALTALLGATGL